MNYWLFKSEPFKFSWDDLVDKGKAGEQWDGVRNYQARNNMRAMEIGDRGFYYHSNEGLEVVGICEVCALAHPDIDDRRPALGLRRHPRARSDAEPGHAEGRQGQRKAVGHGAGDLHAAVRPAGEGRGVDRSLPNGRSRSGDAEAGLTRRFAALKLAGQGPDSDASPPLQPKRQSMGVFTDLGQLVFADGADRVCEDIPESACAEQPRNAGLHIAALTATKTGDALIDPKLVLPWLLNAVGAPAAAIGLLVPLRESLALLPQIIESHRVRRIARRKWVWALGSAVQAAAVAAMAATMLVLEGALAGWLTVGFLAIFALGRSLSSVSYKDVLGKTISKGHRGSVTGLAGSLAAAFALAFGASLAFGILPLTKPVLLGALALAAGLWALAAFLFTLLVEEAGANDDGRDGLRALLRSAGDLWADRQFRLFCLTRALLTVTALAPPYLLLSAGQQGGRALGHLGSFVLASAFAAIVGSYVWGWLSDRSSRQVLLWSAVFAALVLSLAAGLSAFHPFGGWWPMLAPFALFLLQLAYQGVRQGRVIHLTDMAPARERSVYTAFSNTFIGLVLLLMGVFGLVAELIGTSAVLALFALFALAAIPVGWQLDEVQRR